MPDPTLPSTVDAVRRFSRFYTRRIGVLHESFLGCDLSLTEGRVVYELAQRDGMTAARLRAELDLDAGYLSRILRGFERRGLVDRRRSETDGRESVLSLTDAGREMFAAIDRQSRAEVGSILQPLAPAERKRLIAALADAEGLLAAADVDPEPPYTLRQHRPGDLGIVISRHGAIYAEEYGWDGTFEALVAEIAAKFIRDFDPARERCWMAERQGAVVGSVCLVRLDDATAKLRLLYVEREARGLGVGRGLVEACISFARSVGYRKVTLWTNDILVAARGIYERAGFRLVASEPHRSFGHDLVGESWELDL